MGWDGGVGLDGLGGLASRVGRAGDGRAVVKLFFGRKNQVHRTCRKRVDRFIRFVIK